MTDKQLYFNVHQELKSGVKDEALWKKAMAVTAGDIEKASWTYIELRVQDISPEEKPPIETKITIEPDKKPEIESLQDAQGGVSDDMISVSALSIQKNIPMEVLIQQIKLGSYTGRRIDGEWFVKRTENTKAPSHREGSPRKSMGITLVILGIIGGVYSESLDTVSVRVWGSNFGFVNDAGLMAQQQNYLIVSCVAFIAGVILIATSPNSKK